MLCAFATACTGADEPEAQPSLARDNDCVVWLHGKGGGGSSPVITTPEIGVYPEGNGEAWGGHEWSYAGADDFAAAVAVIEESVVATGCVRVVVDGFSNGGAMAAKLYCAGETLLGTLVGVVVDDPVTDASADACAPAEGVEVALYWTGKLPDWGPPGVDCATIDWTCEGGTVVSIDEYASRLGVGWQQSVHTEHDWYLDPPEIADWLADPQPA